MFYEKKHGKIERILDFFGSPKNPALKGINAGNFKIPTGIRG